MFPFKSSFVWRPIIYRNIVAVFHKMSDALQLAWKIAAVIREVVLIFADECYYGVVRLGVAVVINVHDVALDAYQRHIICMHREDAEKHTAHGETLSNGHAFRAEWLQMDPEKKALVGESYRAECSVGVPAKVRTATYFLSNATDKGFALTASGTDLLDFLLFKTLLYTKRNWMQKCTGDWSAFVRHQRQGVIPALIGLAIHVASTQNSKIIPLIMAY